MNQLSKRAALTLLVLAAMTPAHAQMKDMDSMHKSMEMHKGMDMKGDKVAPAPGQVHTAAGTVTKIDAKSGAVTIAHGPVPSMKWPSMSMAFAVRDKVMLDKVAVSKKVDFRVLPGGKQLCA